jgi:hypothetical protein
MNIRLESRAAQNLTTFRYFWHPGPSFSSYTQVFDADVNLMMLLWGIIFSFGYFYSLLSSSSLGYDLSTRNFVLYI